MRAALFVLIAACGSPPQGATSTAPAQTTASATASATSSAKAPTTEPLAARHKAAYAEATEKAARGDFEGASRLLQPFEMETERATTEELAYWIHNQQTWLYWARGDLAGALAQTMQGAAALDRSTLPADAVASMRLHALWDRAYLLVDMNDARADAARADYEALARARNDHDGMAVLEAFFMAKRKKGAEALVAAKRVDVDKDEDLQDLYVIALAHEAASAIT
jgi:hypothetical protein